MRKYYTRACNFYHGSEATRLIQTKKALPLNGKNNIAFDSIEIFSREKRGVKLNLININKVFKLNLTRMSLKISVSLNMSISDVASSKIKIWLFEISALAIINLCL